MDHRTLDPTHSSNLPWARLDDFRTKRRSFEKPCLHHSLLLLVIEEDLRYENRHGIGSWCQSNPRPWEWVTPWALREWSSTWMGLWWNRKRLQGKSCEIHRFQMSRWSCLNRTAHHNTGRCSPLLCNDFTSCSSIWLRSISRSCAGLGDTSVFVGMIMAEVSSSFGAVYLLLATILLVFNMSVPSEIWMDGRVGVRHAERW